MFLLFTVCWVFYWDIQFPDFLAAKLDSTELNWFSLNWDPVQFDLKFKKYKILDSVGFYG